MKMVLLLFFVFSWTFPISDAAPAKKPRKAPARPAAKPPRGWTASPSSLLLFDDAGLLRSEIGLGRWKEESGDGLERSREARGGVCGSGRFAWHWQKSQTVRPGRTERVLSSTTSLVYLGTAGQTLWTDPEAEAPAAGEPLLASADCETLLVLELSRGSWTVVALTFSGKRLARWELGQDVEKASLTRNGRYGSVLWRLADKPLVYSFFDLRGGGRKDLPAADVLLGEAALQEDGSVVADGRTVVRFP